MHLNYFRENSLEFVQEQPQEDIDIYLKRLIWEYRKFDPNEDELAKSYACKLLERNIEEVKYEYSMYFI